METYLQSDGKWLSTVWICRTFYKAEGESPEDSVAKLMQHLSNMLPIYENEILIANEKINVINEMISKPLVQDSV